MKHNKLFAAVLLAGVAAFTFGGASSALAGRGGGGSPHGGSPSFHGGGGGFHPAPVHSAPVHVNPVHVNPVHVNPVHVNPIHNNPPAHGPVHIPPGPVHNPPVHNPPVHNPPVHNPPVHFPPVHNPPVHNQGPIHTHPNGPQHGVFVSGHPHEFHGGNPHVPFSPVARVSHQREPVLIGHGWRGHWIPGARYAYFDAYYWGGIGYCPLGAAPWCVAVGPYDSFFAYDAWAPTEWFFSTDTSMWWSPGSGWVSAPPAGYSDVITVAVQEIKAVLDANGDPVIDPVTGQAETEKVTVYYQAYWDPSFGAYGYQNDQGQYVWLQW